MGTIRYDPCQDSPYCIEEKRYECTSKYLTTCSSNLSKRKGQFDQEAPYDESISPVRSLAMLSVSE